MGAVIKTLCECHNTIRRTEKTYKGPWLHQVCIHWSSFPTPSSMSMFLLSPYCSRLSPFWPWHPHQLSAGESMLYRHLKQTGEAKTSVTSEPSNCCVFSKRIAMIWSPMVVKVNYISWNQKFDTYIYVKCLTWDVSRASSYHIMTSCSSQGAVCLSALDAWWQQKNSNSIAAVKFEEVWISLSSIMKLG